MIFLQEGETERPLVLQFQLLHYMQSRRCRITKSADCVRYEMVDSQQDRVAAS